ncbi:hypothetical protein BZA05DRAFT_30896 [Tricharina praecox]|uniref:uncharacterized protein n=1 Tax=Tricharina praecox TaxID=43433 RepID=UPI00221F7AE3|nr:uncharacterized protein BZA05DRAFT_30896 [Tricharina praecox]KAI5853487.1 hypothetical protein BZA05DRAFT_30896 [Tricharina praecox]
MTAVSTLPSTFTPPASSHGKKNSERGDWEFSVPIDGGDDGDVFQGPHSHNLFNHRNYTTEKPHAGSATKGDFNGSHINGYSNSPSSDYDDRTAGQAGDDGRHYSDYLAAPRAPLLSAKHDSVVSSNHDGDSVFDLYGGRMSVGSGVNDDFSGPTLVSEEDYTNSHALKQSDRVGNGGGSEASKWIHRDKLAQIEGNEADDYLFDIGQSRWIHKDKLEMIEIEELQRNGGSPSQATSTLPGTDDKDLQQHRASSHLGSDDDDEIHGPDFYEIRTPEELAAEQSQEIHELRKGFRRNPSYSRIPLASMSPHPIPQQFIERTTPLPRTAVTPNGSDDGHTMVMPTLRKRSYSAGSNMLLDDRENTPVEQGTPTPASNLKSRAVASPTRASKTASRTNSMAGKQRTRSNPQLNHRPGTSASYLSHGPPPGSSHKKPEGQPPWALASYKPDPSLPPDQQIIPTLAKRLQQEQWERDGVYATVYDREMRPLQVGAAPGEAEKPVAAQLERPESPKEEWPLKSSPPTEPSEPANRHEHKPSVAEGGYRTIPSIQNRPAHESAAPPPVIKQMQPVDEDNEKKKKFGCCIIM